MTARRSRLAALRISAGAVLLLLAVMLALPLGGSALAGAAKVTVTPSDGLGNGQWAAISWSGFSKGGAVYFMQCTEHPKDLQKDCTSLFIDYGVSNAAGAGKIFLPVTVGDVPAAGGGKFTCDSDHPCSFGVFDNDPSKISNGVFPVLHFAVTPDSCPAPKGDSILGSGASSSFLAMYTWEGLICRPPTSLSVGYTLGSSASGRSNYIVGNADFGITGDPFTKDDLSQLDQAKKAFEYAPVTSSGLVLAYKIYAHDGFGNTSQITDLKLTPDLVAKIYSGQIDNWNLDPEINALNPKYRGQLPPQVHALSRGDASAANMTFTSWLDANAKPSSLPDGWNGPSELWSADYNTGINTSYTGGDKLVTQIATPDNPEWLTQGYLGYVDSSLAAYYGLPTVQIQNPGGQYVTATPQTVDAAIADAKAGKDGVLSFDYANKDKTAYPMPMVDYATAPTKGIDPGKGGVMADFLNYAVNDGQKAGTLPPGYVPLAKDLVDQTMSTLPDIPGSDVGKHKDDNPGGNNNPGGGGGGSYTGTGSGLGTLDTGTGTTATGLPPSTGDLTASTGTGSTTPTSCPTTQPSGGGAGSKGASTKSRGSSATGKDGSSSSKGGTTKGTPSAAASTSSSPSAASAAGSSVPDGAVYGAQTDNAPSGSQDSGGSAGDAGGASGKSSDASGSSSPSASATPSAATPSPDASAVDTSPTPGASPSASPSAAAATGSSGTVTGCAAAEAGTVFPTGTIARAASAYVLPVVAGLAAFGLAGGPLLQTVARRRGLVAEGPSFRRWITLRR